MLAQAVKRFVRISLPRLTHMKCFIALYFRRRQSSSVIRLQRQRQSVAIQEVHPTRAQVNFDFEFCSCDKGFAFTTGEIPWGYFALLWRGGQSLAREERSVLRKGNVNHAIGADFDFEEGVVDAQHDPITELLRYRALARLSCYQAGAEQSRYT